MPTQLILEREPLSKSLTAKTRGDSVPVNHPIEGGSNMSKAMASSNPRVQYKDLREYLKLLESAGLLHRFYAEVELND